jgi:hypothetical protein
VGGGGLGDCDAGGLRGDAGVDEAVSESGEVAAGHVDDEGGLVGEGARPAWSEGKFSGAWWAVARMSFEAAVRSVSGVLRQAATAKAAVIPGTISKEMPASRRAAISSPARPKMSGSPDLRRTTERSARTWWSMRKWISAWVMRGWPQRLPTGMISAEGLARSRTSSETRSSGRMMSAVWRSRRARRVSRPGSPGPAPTR